jgi:ABC transporter substrate binding protein (PQQ-dependent alcohol dehydrogenase system)
LSAIDEPQLAAWPWPAGGQNDDQGVEAPMAFGLGWRGIVCAVVALASGAAAAQDKPRIDVPITYLSRSEAPVLHLSLAEPELTDEGLMGARQALKENETTGRFLGHDYRLIERVAEENGDLGAIVDEALAAGERLLVADLRKDDLLAIAPKAEAAGAIVLSARAPDDELRTDNCSPAVFHLGPSRAMKADALAQYLVWKRWRNWFLIEGSHPEDKAFADVIRRAATRFGAEIVASKTYEDTGAARRTDSGHVQVQSQMPVFTQDAPDYDVLVAADENEVFGEYLPYLTWAPRPVVGTAGLVPSAWSRVHEQWGGTQVQRRFERFAKRPMTERDHIVWIGIRALGEAVTRTNSADPATLRAYMRSPEFQLAAFKGQALTFRTWNQQMRQPILLVTPRMLVSVSPQEGFLHQRTPLDTLGYDEPESRCRLED